MQLKELKIKNIRSYTDEIIEFPEGTTLLSGNIGVGKSTILLAIEFALFGVTKEMPGAALLRNGAEKGSVELQFSVGDKEITIKRGLKRGSSVAQETGSITINNATKEASATELKQSILSVLQYPQELLTKSRSLVYRYTVYTPQEEMKSILTGSKDARLDTLRRVFGIDKYKIIKENVEVFISKIRARTRDFAIMVADVEKLQEEKKQVETKIQQLQEAIVLLVPEEEKVKQELEQHKKQKESIEAEIKHIQEQKKKVEVYEAQIIHTLAETKRNKERAEVIEAQITRLQEELTMIKTTTVDEAAYKEKEGLIAKEEQAMQELLKKLHELRATQGHAKKIIEDIEKLDVCPVCKQQVNKEHLTQVRSEEQQKIDGSEQERIQIERKEQERQEKIKKLKEELEILRKQKEQQNILLIKKETLAEKQKELTQVQEHITQNKREIGRLNTEKAAISITIDTTEKEEKYNNIIKTIEKIQEQEKSIAIKRATQEKENEYVQQKKFEVEKSIKEKEKIKEKIIYLKGLQEWLEKQFVNVVLTIEKKVMLKVHSDFNELFQKWFGMLVDSERIKVKIDEEFTPVIEQNGHMIDYSYLSGGEKSAAALAYRLALNQVINTVVSTIRTRDVLILDEPTDGFSSEQLDRLRHVLEELDAKQVIIVSHESKIESFVENVIKLEKNEHQSSIVYT